MAKGPKPPNFGSRVRVKPAEARPRLDGEMYSRPQPNPFSDEWSEGFTDGFDGVPSRIDSMDYRDGYITGKQEREFEAQNMDRTNSSNA